MKVRSSSSPSTDNVRDSDLAVVVQTILILGGKSGTFEGSLFSVRSISAFEI